MASTAWPATAERCTTVADNDDSDRCLWRGRERRSATRLGAGCTLRSTCTATTNLNAAAYSEILHHLYEVPLSGEPRSLTSGQISHEKAAFSPDGKRICFTTTASKENYYALSRLAFAAWPWNYCDWAAPSFIGSVATSFSATVKRFISRPRTPDGFACGPLRPAAVKPGSRSSPRRASGFR